MFGILKYFGMYILSKLFQIRLSVQTKLT